jgi:uncharacterized protein YfaS (alpha-2-macroglobulin family)
MIDRIAGVKWVLVAGLVACACSSATPEVESNDPVVQQRASSDSGEDDARQTTVAEDEETTVEMSVRASESGEPAERPELLEGKAVGGAEADEFLARLPGLPSVDDDEEIASLPTASPPAPRAGGTQRVALGAGDGGDPPETATSDEPLEVVRKGPEGAVRSAGRLSVTFSKPMVSLAAREASAGGRADGVPLSLEPAVEGQWRWVGTDTVIFEPETGRFPMATPYEAAIEKSAEATDGTKLGETVSWTFQTPTLKAESVVIDDRGPLSGVSVLSGETEVGPVGKRPVFAIGFNQRIDRDAVAGKLKVWGGGQTYRTYLVDDNSIRQKSTISRILEQFGEDRSIVFRVQGELRPATTYKWGVGPGVSSAEGPRETTEGQYATFTTYPPLDFVGHEKRERWPGYTFELKFNNELSAVDDMSSAGLVDVRPELSDDRVTITTDGKSLLVGVRPEPNTTYTVSVSADLQDRWGQKLGESMSAEFEVGSAPTDVGLAGSQMQIRTSNEPTHIPLSASGSKVVRVTLYRLTPSDWPAVVRARRPQSLYKPNREIDWPGQKIDERRVTLSEGKRRIDRKVEFADALGDGEHGQVLVVARAVERVRGAAKSDATGSASDFAWIQVTDIGLDAFVDRQTLVGWASSLKTGEPLDGVSLSLAGVDEVRETDGNGTAELKLPEASPAQIMAQRHDSSLAAWLKAERDGDVAFLPRSMSSTSLSTWGQRTQGNTVRWYLVDDREMYRPGETIAMKGWLRGVAEDGRTMQIPEGPKSLSWSLVGSRGNELKSREVSMTETGGFSVAFDLPEDINLGRARLSFETEIDGESRSVSESFHIQEFRTPTFETSVQASPDTGALVGDEIRAEVEAAYFSGGKVTGGDVQWQIRAERGSYRPPGWGDFDFGPWSPWWSSGWWQPDSGPIATEQVAGTTNAQGKDAVTVGIDRVEPTRPVVVNTEARVTDITREQIAGRDSVLVHPASHYVGLRTEERIVQAGEPLNVQAVVTNIDGDVVEGRRIDVRVARLEWKKSSDGWDKVAADPKNCTLTSEDRPVVCEVPTERAGEYIVRATVTDNQGRSNVTEVRRWVTGGGGAPERGGSTQLQELKLIPGQATYEPGDTARVLVRAPFESGHGKLVVWRDTMEKRLSFELDGGSATVEFPVEDGDVPKLTARATVVGETSIEHGAAVDAGGDVQEPSGGSRPVVADGELTLEVPPTSRTLAVEVQPSVTSTEPGGSVDAKVTVTGPDGSAVKGAEVAVIAVDEAVLSLSDYRLPSPLDVMYQGWGPTVVETAHARRLFSMPEMADTPPFVPNLEKSRRYFSLGSASGESAGSAPVNLRENLTPLAHFAPAVRTDGSGVAETTIELPDNLTRYRVYALVAEGNDRFGRGEAKITARKPVTVRPSMPRFLNHGDETALPVLVRNQTGQCRTVTVGLRSNRLEVEAPQVKVVELPANGRGEVRFSATAGQAGETAVQVLAATESEKGDSEASHTDAIQRRLPVYTPATTEAFASYGSIEGDGEAIAQPIEVPTDALSGYGEVSVTTSSTILQALTDAVVYLVEYPYNCTEQLASRVLTVGALQKVLSSFEANGLPPADELRERVFEDIDALLRRQRRGGGFGYWREDGRTWPFVSVHALHALGVSFGTDLAADRKDDATLGMMRQGGRYLEGLRREIPERYSQTARLTIRAYGLYVAEKVYGDLLSGRFENLSAEGTGLGRRVERPKPYDAQKLESLASRLADMEEPPLEAVAWTLSAITMAKDRLLEGAEAQPKLEKAGESLREILDERAVQEGPTAQLVTDYRREDSHWIMASSRRVDALALEALLRSNSEHPLIPKLARGLQQHRVKGRWASTQENVFVLLALREYFDRKEEQSPAFVAKTWLGESFVGSHQFEGRTTERQKTSVPMEMLRSLAEDEQRDASTETDTESSASLPLTLQKQGTGRLYYRIGLSYAPEDYDLAAASRGFSVERRYEAVGASGTSSTPSGAKEDESHKVVSTEKGWRVELGTRVRVRVTMVAPGRRYHVALVDNLPAGFEPINPVFETSGWVPPESEDDGSFWWGPWYGHDNLRDSRAEAFATQLAGGVYTYTYTARATTPGTYHVPPARAEEMYAPEVFGRTGSAVVEIVE